MTSVPWIPYTFKPLWTVTLCEETGQQQSNGYCPVHGGDGCLRVYRHPDLEPCV